MARDTNEGIDLILATRLDLLEQAVEEAYTIIDAMREQRLRLASVEEFLSPKGRLSGSENRTRMAVEDATRRVSQILAGRTDATPKDVEYEDEQEAASRDAREPGPAEDEDRRLLKEAFRILSEAKPSLDRLVSDRKQAHATFQDVQRWSVAGLADEELTAAAAEYGQLLEEIKNATDPWRHYERETRGRGKRLFTSYLELLGGMAVRGVGLDVDELKDRAALMKLLLTPLGRDADQAPQLRSLHVPMQTRHLPLGYGQWGLWALPLVGGTVGRHLLETGVFRTAPGHRLSILCADVYALYVLGPSYLQAALFLELDPDDTDGSEVDGSPPQPSWATGLTVIDEVPSKVSDAYRAEVLLTMLPKLDDSSADELRSISEAIAQSWRAARQAFGGTDVALAHDDVVVLEEFLNKLRKEYAGLAYDMRWLSDARENGRRLAAGGDALDGLVLKGRDLVNAVWLARLETPTASRELHDNAKIVARRRAGPSHPWDPTGTSRQRGGF